MSGKGDDAKTNTKELRLVLEPFCLRQFRPGFTSGTPIPPPYLNDPERFLRDLLELLRRGSGVSGEAFPLADGYAPFCKHIFVPNFAGCICGYVCIREEGVKIPSVPMSCIRSAYESRRSSELPVLVRYVPSEAVLVELAASELPKGKFLDIILYSRQQCIEENVAMRVSKAIAELGPGEDEVEVRRRVTEEAKKEEEEKGVYDYAVVSIKCIDRSVEVPMQPITMIRNALGKEEGGSGVRLDPGKYRESVAFWDKHVSIRLSEPAVK